MHKKNGVHLINARRITKKHIFPFPYFFTNFVVTLLLPSVRRRK